MGSKRREIKDFITLHHLSDACQDDLLCALTHSSALHQRSKNYERLEFLGDRLLGLIISEHLLTAFPDANEGELSRRLNQLVRKETCAQIAQTLSLGDYAFLSPAESAAGGRKREGLLADMMEAVIAAIYRTEGYTRITKFVLALWTPKIKENSTDIVDAKSALQEWAQARDLPLPDYSILDRAGPDHKPIFTIQVALSTGETATGCGTSRRIAEQAAAADLLQKVHE
jgi:ribonuclease-3